MLSIKNLHASIEGKEILKGINLEVKPGEVHAIMGPNGAGKSTLANIIAGKDDYEVTAGSIELNGQDISELSPEERAHEGIFLSFQYPDLPKSVQNIIIDTHIVNETGLMNDTYVDLDKLSSEQLVKAVESAGDGKTYKVSDLKTIKKV